MKYSQNDKELPFPDGQSSMVTWPQVTERGILKDIEISKDNAWVRETINGSDFSRNVFFTLFGEDRKPLVYDDEGTVRKQDKKRLRIPGFSFGHDIKTILNHLLSRSIIRGSLERNQPQLLVLPGILGGRRLHQNILS